MTTKLIFPKMERHQHMKSFINAAADYTRHPSEANISILQRNLVILAASLDLRIFDPGSSIATEFYVSLHELMNLLGSRTQLIWNALDVLQTARKNTAARQALIHIYKFTPILTRLLETNLTPEKRIRVLKLLQELTYGVKISWQEVHLPYLISLLTQWVTQSKEEEVIALSLGILVNLCYKNLPAVYTLMRTVDTKSFTRALIKTASNRASMRVQCCKLMIILEVTHHDISEKHLLEFVTTTFTSLVAALHDRDVLLLRHIVDFFNDVRQNNHSRSVILNYPNYVEDVSVILADIKSESDPECVSLVMEFLLALVNLKLSVLTPLYPLCVKVSMAWVPIEQVCSKALALIRTIVMDCRKSKISPDVLAELDLSVLMLVANIEDDESGTNESRSPDTQSRLTELMQLLQEMARIPALKNRVMEAFGEKAMRQLLRPILEQDDAAAAGEWPGALFNDPATTLYIHALGLTADLAGHDSTWLTLHSELLQKKQIQTTVALALYTADSEVKQKVLQLMAAFPQECISSVARCMSELEPLVLVQNAAEAVTSVIKNPVQHPASEMAPLFSFDQQSRLDTFLSKLEDAYHKNKIEDITTSAVMELYDYKLAAMRHADRATQASLETANNYATSLLHRLAQFVAESSRLHQLLFHSQQSLEGVLEEKAAMEPKLRRIPVLEKTISELKKELDASLGKLDSVKRRVKELETELSTVQASAKEIHNLNKEMKKTLNKKEQIIEERDREIATNQEGISALKQEVEQMTRQCQKYEQTITEKEETVQRMTAELVELSRMRDMIYNLTAKKKEEQNTTT